MKKELIRRNYDFEIRAEKDEKRGNIIVGRPIVYESKTDIAGMFAEIIERGALKKTNLEDVRFLVNHDQSKVPLARSRRNSKNSTMQLSVDDEGMEIQVELDTENNTEARNLYSAIERGDITGMSFMFKIDDEEWEDLDSDYPTRHIKSISTVVEVSAVTFPAYEETSISARDKSVVETARIAVETARSGEVDTSSKEKLELEKLKLKYLLGGN